MCSQLVFNNQLSHLERIVTRLSILFATILLLLRPAMAANDRQLIENALKADVTQHLSQGLTTNAFAATSTMLYVYIVDRSAQTIKYIGGGWFGPYTATSAATELAGMGCTYSYPVAGNSLGAAYAAYTVDFYDCLYGYHAYAAIMRHNTSGAVPVIYWYVISN